MLRSPALLTALAVAGCKDKETAPADDTGSGVTIETGEPVDTPDDVETGETAEDTDDSGDSGDTGDTGDTALPTTAELVRVSLYPDAITVNPGATWDLRLVGHFDDGTWAELPGSYSVGDPKVLSVGEGDAITALAAGQTTITATYGEFLDVITAKVADDGLIKITVLDASTGLPIDRAKIKVFEEDAYRTDETGVGTAPVSTGGPIAVTAYLDGYIPATVWNTVSRDITIPIYPEGYFDADSAQITGNMDFGDVADGGFSDMVIGLTVPTMQSGPLLLEPDDLLAPDRTVTVYGVDADVPSNLVIEDEEESYTMLTPPGDVAAWAIAGPMPISDVTEGLNGTGDAIELLRDHIDDMVWGWGDAGAVTADDPTALNIGPSYSFSRSISVDVGDLSLGFQGDEEPLVMVGDWLDPQGVIVTGLSLGTGEVDVDAADVSFDGSLGEVAMAIGQVGGLGDGGAISASWAPIDGGEAVLPELQIIPTVASFDPVTHNFALSSDARARYVRVLIEGGDGSMRMMYLDSGEQSGEMPDPGGSMGYGNTTWTLLALETEADTFEGFLTSGDLSPEELALRARTASRVSIKP